MRIKHLLLLILFVVSFKAFSQDALYRKDGIVENVKIVEVNKTDVKYRTTGKPDVLKVIYVSEVYKIVYEDGTIELFEQKTDYAPPVAEETGNVFGRNFISANAFDILYKQATVSYEYFLSSGYISFKLPFSVRLFPENLIYNSSYFGHRTYYNENKIYSTGLQINFYPGGQGRIKYFLGPAYEYGKFYIFRSYLDQNGNNTVIKKMSIPYNGLYLQNGVLFNLSDNFNFNVGLGLGASKYTMEVLPGLRHVVTRSEGRVVMNFGYRF
jgi:hypothetical protein